MRHYRKLSIPALFVAILIATLAISAVYGQDSCIETLESDGTVEGEWEQGCSSDISDRGYARYYTFTLAEPSEVTIILESLEIDTYLYLRDGSSRSGTIIDQNDDHESTNRSRIDKGLADGTYTIEATTYHPDETGSFTLSVHGISEDQPGSYRSLVTALRSGHFHHEPDRVGTFRIFSANVDVYDVAASVFFQNPYNATDHDFSYGLVVRSNAAANPPVRFFVLSYGRWVLEMGDFWHNGPITNLNTLKYQWNQLSMGVVGKYAALSLNRVPLTNDAGEDVFHVGSGTNSGDVFIGQGMFSDTEQNGAITYHSDFAVYQIIPDRFIDDAREASTIVQEVSERSTSPKTSVFGTHRP